LKQILYFASFSNFSRGDSLEKRRIRKIIFGPDILSKYELEKYREILEKLNVDENTFITNSVRHMIQELAASC